ncbi:hypothetical protein A6764_08145 [Brevibacillus sp. WF146]|uniref:hypothetical protein n=1 Tax=Brevibacillus sp. WF146 TaxID=319501 RepID=UPI002227535D|nr:hypothetical protein [Brevibacillus sp. WF146]UYZ14889.1 hypothetical protein A6764_08145 [Brevibacillus sp. WF146]
MFRQQGLTPFSIRQQADCLTPAATPPDADRRVMPAAVRMNMPKLEKWPSPKGLALQSVRLQIDDLMRAVVH